MIEESCTKLQEPVYLSLALSLALAVTSCVTLNIHLFPFWNSVSLTIKQMFEFDILPYTLGRRIRLILCGRIPKFIVFFKKQDSYS